MFMARPIILLVKFAGIVTHSSGNHGQAVAYACNVAAVPCTVVVPKDTPNVKVCVYNAVFL